MKFMKSNPHDENMPHPEIKKRIWNFIINVIIAALIAVFLNLFVIGTTKVTSESMEGTILKGDFLFLEKLSFGAKTPSAIPFTNIELQQFRLPGISSVERGDILLFENPISNSSSELNNNYNYVKRCIALPGDTLEIKNRIIIINNTTFVCEGEVQFTGHSLNSNKNLFPDGSNWTMDNYGPIYIPKKNDRIHLNHENIELYRDLINSELNHPAVKTADGGIYIDGVNVNEYEIKNNYYFLLGDNRNRSADSRFWGFLNEEKIIGRIFLIYMSVDSQAADSNSSFFEKVRWNRIAKFVR